MGYMINFIHFQMHGTPLSKFCCSTSINLELISEDYKYGK
jgi:hypothetical protein